jgi:hypothetical protein
MTGLVWSILPFRCVGRAPRSADAHRVLGAHGIRIRTQLYSQC